MLVARTAPGGVTPPSGPQTDPLRTACVRGVLRDAEILWIVSASRVTEVCPGVAWPLVGAGATRLFLLAGHDSRGARVWRECEGECRPVRAGSHIGRCVVGLRDAGHDGKSQPGAWHPACGRCPVEAFEDVGEILVWNPGAVIGDRHVAFGDGDVYRAVGWIPLDRVVDQVADGVVDPGGVRGNQAGVQGRGH